MCISISSRDYSRVGSGLLQGITILVLNGHILLRVRKLKIIKITSANWAKTPKKYKKYTASIGRLAHFYHVLQPGSFYRAGFCFSFFVCKIISTAVYVLVLVAFPTAVEISYCSRSAISVCMLEHTKVVYTLYICITLDGNIYIIVILLYCYIIIVTNIIIIILL